MSQEQKVESNMPQRMLTVPDVADLLRLSAPHVYNMKQRGELPPPVMVGKREYRWLPEDIKAWMEARKAQVTR